MSTFGGLIEEIPGISVDRFDGENLKSSLFFLSHCHTDHMQGLIYQTDFVKKLLAQNQYLYCSPISKKILEYKLHRFGPEADFIKTIDGVSPIIVEYNVENKTEYLKVTSISAGHCPGSVMFLFEIKKISVLYTGDFRFDSKDLSKFKPLHDFVDGKMIPKKFDNIYLDTTFFNPNNDFFPSRQDCVREICKVASDWISKDNNNIVILECSAHYGPEYLFIELSNALKLRIHVKDKVYKSYTFFPELSKCVTDDPNATPIHACMEKNFRRFYVLQCRPKVKDESIITIIPSVWRWRYKDVKKNICEWEAINKRFYTCYSCHSSFSELKNFIEYFKPSKLYPCVVPINANFDDFKNTLNEILINSEEATNNFTGFNMKPLKFKPLDDAKKKTFIEKCYKVASRKILECNDSKKIITTKVQDFVPGNLPTKSSSKKSKENKNKADKKNKYLKNAENDVATDKKEVLNQVYDENDSSRIFFCRLVSYFLKIEIVASESRVSGCSEDPARGSLANEVAKAREHIKKGLQCVSTLNNISDDSTVPTQDLMGRLTLLEKDNRELHSTVKKLNKHIVDLEAAIKKLEVTVNGKGSAPEPHLAVCPAKPASAALMMMMTLIYSVLIQRVKMLKPLKLEKNVLLRMPPKNLKNPR
ncbi:GSCOCG00004906001-RA-CDS [Cotesia congregata]|nr:GSCOCG00004906001-RA-CDS [Cotesia congregata]